MSVQPLYSPKFRAFDSNGDSLSGGFLYTYAAGTSTPLATYTTRAGTIANANPVVLNANGEADIWGTPGVLYKLELRNSLGVVQWTVDNVPAPSEQDTSDDVTTDPGGRLTLTTVTPVTTSDVSAATTIYYTPYKHDRVPLYDGTAWALYAISTELSQTTTDATKSPAAVAVNSNYDLFVWSDSGTLRLSRGPAWTSDTARGTGAGTTELQRLNGRYVNKIAISNGPAAQRGLYVGTVRSDASSQVNDSATKRHVWNSYNRIPRRMLRQESTSYSYTTATFRQANASTANALDIVRGLDEDMASFEVASWVTNATAASSASVGIGLDSTTADSSVIRLHAGMSAAADNRFPRAVYLGLPGLGRHLMNWLEKGHGAGTDNWNNGVGLAGQAGFAGSILA